MPITQDRMVALLRAAKDYQDSWKRVQIYMDGVDRDLKAERITLPEAWGKALNLLQYSLQLGDPIGTTETLANETTHFRLMYNRNTASAKWQKAKRDGVELPRQRKKQDRGVVNRKLEVENRSGGGHAGGILEPGQDTWAARSVADRVARGKEEITPDTALDFGAEEEPEAPEATVYIPGTGLTQEQKDSIEQEMRSREAGEQIEELVKGLVKPGVMAQTPQAAERRRS